MCNCLCAGGDVCDEAHIVKLFIRLLVIVYRWDDRRFVIDHCSVCDVIVVLERSRPTTSYANAMREDNTLTKSQDRKSVV